MCNQIWATLYDYPCLRSCEKLVRYIKDSVRLAWALVNQVSYYERTIFERARKWRAVFNVRSVLDCLSSRRLSCSSTKRGTSTRSCTSASTRRVRTTIPSRRTCGRRWSKATTVRASTRRLSSHEHLLSFWSAEPQETITDTSISTTTT